MSDTGQYVHGMTVWKLILPFQFHLHAALTVWHSAFTAPSVDQILSGFHLSDEETELSRDEVTNVAKMASQVNGWIGNQTHVSPNIFLLLRQNNHILNKLFHMGCTFFIIKAFPLPVWVSLRQSDLSNWQNGSPFRGRHSSLLTVRPSLSRHYICSSNG